MMASVIITGRHGRRVLEELDMNQRLLGWGLIGVGILALLAVPAVAGIGTVAKVTYVDGPVTVGSSTAGPWQPLQLGDGVRVGQAIRTSAKGIVELTLLDQSVLRVASDSLIRVDAAAFEKNKRKGFSASLILGKIWARIAKLISASRSDFTVKTATAVVGVRGTVYNLVVDEAAGTEVSVFSGTVAVGPVKMAADGPKKEMAWPGEVTERQWEEILLGRLQRLRVGVDGRPDRPQAFDPTAEADPWTRWNLDRDAALAAAK